MTRSEVRLPVAAGTFYPGEPRTLAAMVDVLLAAADPRPEGPDPVALVAPHAGYVYSGPIAATAYTLTAGMTARPSRVAILGPAHFVPLAGTAVPEAAAWATPLGTVEMDRELRAEAAAHGSAVDDGPHFPDHAIEVQLPFLQRILGDDLLVLPVAVGESDPEEIASLTQALADVPGTLIVVSTDLSHHLDQDSARARDDRTAKAVLDRDPAALSADSACGAHALRGLMTFARRRNLVFDLLDLRTSADTAGDPSSVVGYGAFALRKSPGTRPVS